MINPQEDTGQPLVSVVCLTYKHEKYLAQAIESFLAQETDFSFEVLIHDDASPDGTLAIARQYADKYPHIIRVIAQTENQHSKGVRIPPLLFAKARGRFIAYCEGDDFWIDNHKLQKQADLLLRDEELGAIFTDADILYEGKSKLIKAYDRSTRRKIPTGDVRKSLLVGNPYKTCTSMFRLELVMGYEVMADRLRARMCDYVWWLTIAENTKVAYINQSTATYRVLRQSASHFVSAIPAVRFARSGLRVALYFNKRFSRLIPDDAIWHNYRNTVLARCLSYGHYRAAVRRAKSPQELLLVMMRVIARWLTSRVMAR